MKKYLFIIGVLSLLFMYSCSSVNVSSDYDHTANFSSYKTYAFYQKGLDNLKVNDLDKRRITGAIIADLQSKGLTNTNDESTADLIVNLAASHKTQVEVNSDMSDMYMYPYGYPYWGWGPGYYGSPDYTVSQYKEGSLVIDFIDRAKNILVWQGVGDGFDISNLNNKGERINDAVDDILKNYPPKR